MDTLSLNIGDQVELLVQIYPQEQWVYIGDVMDTTDTSVVIFTEDSPHHGEGEFREIEVPLAKIIKAEVFV